MLRHLVFPVVVLAAALPNAAHAQNPTAEYHQLAADWAAACTKGDARAIAALYTADAVTIEASPTGAIRTVGRADIEKKMAADLAGPMKGATCTVTVASIRFPKPDIALAEGGYSVAVPGQPTVQGLWINTAIRQAGKWIIAHDMGALKP